MSKKSSRSASGSSSSGLGLGNNASFMQSNSLYLAFKDQKSRDEIYELINEQASVKISTSSNLGHIRKLWHEGKISNYDYLLHVNHAAGRSFNDITQYPVFPWVLQDYTSRKLNLNDRKVFRDLSKPIGALESNRLRTFKKRMREMPSEMSHGKPFLYGTHYSAPGYVLYFLVRKAPEYMLRLQSGHFDVPDRLFHSMQDAWQSVLSSNTDVKELIPEFYNVDTKGDFCLNTKNLDLGVRQDGTEVDDLILPRWARSARQFVSKMREALECKYVSDHLHHWIDLVFGYKQSGDEALKADNLFFPLTYEGAIDIEKITDATERASIEAQIREFGQTPRKIFRDPHPARSEVASGSGGDPSSGQRGGRGRKTDQGHSGSTEFEQQGGGGLPMASSWSGGRGNSGGGERRSSAGASFGTNRETGNAGVGPASRNNQQHQQHQQQQGRRGENGSSQLGPGHHGRDANDDIGKSSGRLGMLASVEFKEASGVYGDGVDDGGDGDRTYVVAAGGGGGGILRGRKGDSYADFKGQRRMIAGNRFAGSNSGGSVSISNGGSVISSNLRPSSRGRSSRERLAQNRESAPAAATTTTTTATTTTTTTTTAAAGGSFDSSGIERTCNNDNNDTRMPSMLHADQEKNPYCRRWHSFRKIQTPQRKVRAHRRAITDLCVDNCGKVVASTALDATLKIHGLDDGKQKRSFKVNRRSLSLALSSCTLSPDAQTVVMGSWDNSVYVYSVSQGTVVSEGRGHEDAVSSVALSENRVVSGSWDGTVKLWNLDRSTLSSVPILDLHDHDHPVTCVCTDPTGRLACSASQAGLVLVWDLRTGKRQRSIQAHKREITALKLSNTGYDFTTVCNDGHVKTFDLTKGECFSDIDAEERLSCVETDGDVVFTGGEDGIVKMWEMNDSKSKSPKPTLQTEDLGSKISCLSLSRDGSWLVAGVESEEGEEDIVIFRTES